MVRKKSKKTVLPLLVIISAIIFTGLIGAITFQQIAPTTNPFITPLPNVTISTGVHCPDGCSSFTHSWNGTNTTLYDSSLVLFMNFDNRSELGENNTYVQDLSLYNNSGTLAGILTNPTTGKYNGGLIGDRSGFLNISSSASLNLTNKNYTIFLCLKPYELVASDLVVVSKYKDDYTSRYGWGIRTYNTAIYFRVNDTLLNAQVSTSNSAVNVWSCYVFGYNGTHIIEYMNGVYKGSTAWTNTLADADMSLKIGGNSVADDFNGSIDDVMIWNRSLSINEMNTLFNTQMTKYNSTYWEINRTQNNSIDSKPYFQCSTNLTGTQFCSSTKYVSQANIVKTNFSTSRGNVQNTFYGSNVHTTGLNSDFGLNSFLNSNMNLVTVDLSEWAWINNSDGTFSISSQTTVDNVKNQVALARLYGFKVMLLGSGGMPYWIQNKSSNCIGNNETCAPLNYTQWGNLQREVIWYVTNQGQWLDTIAGFTPYNEPNSALLINDSTQAGRMFVYYQIYNNSWNVIKANSTLSSLPIGGPSGHFGYGTNSLDEIRWDWWFGNFTTQMDFNDIHIYKDSFTLSSRFNTKLNGDFYGNCTLYSANCSKIYVTEWNVYSDVIRNTSSQQSFYGAQIGDFYINILNQLQNNISLSIYQYLNGKWGMINSTYNSTATSYNVTKNFAHLCPSGATVYVSSNDDDTIKQVSCKKGNMYSLIVINTDTNAKNITLNMSMENGTILFPYSSLRSYEDDDTIYKVTDGITQLGVMDSYEILYLYSGLEDGADLVNLFRLNEYTGSVVYDALFGTSNGTRSGATWVTDGVLKTLTSVTDYVFSGDGILTLVSDNIFSYLFINWDLSSVSVLRENFSAGIDNVSGKIPLLFLVLIVGVILIVLGGLTALFYLLMKKVPSRFSGGV